MTYFKLTAIAAISLAFSGVAHAAPAKCGGMYKTLQELQARAKDIPNKQSELAAIFDEHDEVRANIRAELSNRQANLGGDDTRSTEELEVALAEHNEKAEAAKVSLAELNEEAQGLNAKQAKLVADFNKTCTN